MCPLDRAPTQTPTAWFKGFCAAGPPLCAAMSLDFAALGIVADPFGVYCLGGICVAGIIVYFFGGIYVYFLE